MTDSPSVTCPSPARTTLPLRRMDSTVVERISRFVDMRAILDYSSGESPLMRKQESTTEARRDKRKVKRSAGAWQRCGESQSPRPFGELRAGSVPAKNAGTRTGQPLGWAIPYRSSFTMYGSLPYTFPEGERTCLKRHMRQNATHGSTPESVRKRKTLLRRRQDFVVSRLRTF